MSLGFKMKYFLYKVIMKEKLLVHLGLKRRSINVFQSAMLNLLKDGVSLFNVAHL